MPTTLRWRLVLLYVGILAAVLGALGVFTYGSLRASLISVRVSTLSGDIDVGRQLFASSAKITVAQAPGRLATTVGIASGQTVGVIIYGPNGTAIGENAGSSGVKRNLPRLGSADVSTALAGNRSEPLVIEGSGGPWLALAFPGVTRAHGLGNVAIQASVPMQPITDVLNRVLALFAIGGGAALALAFAVGLWLTSRTLRPLHRLAATAGELAQGNLSARTQMKRGDEVGTVATAFDHMADQVQRLFSEQKASEDQVRRFIADASHELRTPITALKGYIDIMRRGAGRDEVSLDSILISMGTEADRMRVLILDLLTLARVDARLVASTEITDVAELTNRVLVEGAPGMPTTVERNIPSEPVTVRVERSALETVLRNLLINACTYAPGSAQHWSVATAGNSVVITAADDGPGIAHADLPHVFERFYRGEKTRAREEGGSGLGLAIVKGLIEANGGTVGIYSNPGEGTRVVVTLVRAARDA